MPSSMTAAVKGAVTAALLTALEQAVGSSVERIPWTDRRFEPSKE